MREDFANTITVWQQKVEVGFQSMEVEWKGKYLLRTLTDVLWVIDGHSPTLADRSYQSSVSFPLYCPLYPYVDYIPFKSNTAFLHT
jgi:hypothetical protein